MMILLISDNQTLGLCISLYSAIILNIIFYLIGENVAGKGASVTSLLLPVKPEVSCRPLTTPFKVISKQHRNTDLQFKLLFCFNSFLTAQQLRVKQSQLDEPTNISTNNFC